MSKTELRKATTGIIGLINFFNNGVMTPKDFASQLAEIFPKYRQNTSEVARRLIEIEVIETNGIKRLEKACKEYDKFARTQNKTIFDPNYCAGVEYCLKDLTQESFLESKLSLQENEELL